LVEKVKGKFLGYTLDAAVETVDGLLKHPAKSLSGKK
jgi:hypothetical protein